MIDTLGTKRRRQYRHLPEPWRGEIPHGVTVENLCDKMALLGTLNEVFGMEQRFVCVSRPHRFGKTMAVNKICACYDRTVADEAFSELAIAQAEEFS